MTLPAFNKIEPQNIDVNKEEVRQQINVYLHRELASDCLTPYIGLERVRRVLAYYHIHLPNINFLEGDHGVETFEVLQFGVISGINDKGEVVTKDPLPYDIYFEYQITDEGMYKIFCEIVDEEDLDELLDDVEDDINDESPEEDREEQLDEGKRNPPTPEEKAAREKARKENKNALARKQRQLARRNSEVKKLTIVKRLTKKPTPIVTDPEPTPDVPKVSFKAALEKAAQDKANGIKPTFSPRKMHSRPYTPPNVKVAEKPGFLARLRKLVKLKEDSSTTNE